MRGEGDTRPLALGALVRAYRARLGLTREELAARATVGLSVDTIANIERGRTRPYRPTLETLADALGLDAAARADLHAARDRARTGGSATTGSATAPVDPTLSPILPSTGAYPLPPAPLTRLIGREQQEAALAALLRGAGGRLVTLLGPGGVGKTRLAIQIAAVLRDAFPDGVAWIDLAPLREPDLVVPTLARALGVREAGTVPVAARLRDRLRGQRLLLVLDNLERVVAAGPTLAALLADCPGVAALVTSRVALQVRGEQTFPLPPLGLPDRPTPGAPVSPSALDKLMLAPAVALLVQRARAARPSFALTAENAAAVAAICARLDGLPLALELAAPRLALLSPAALLARLDRGLATLTHGPADLPDRQRALRATLDWSHDLLDADERILFARLSVFSGGGTLTAIEALCARLEGGDSDPLAGLAALVNQSLLRRGIAPDDAPPRFALLETLREYAAERLAASGEEEDVRRAHAAYYLALAEDADATLRGPGQGAALARLEAERDNLRTALAWATGPGGDAALAARLVTALDWWWYLRADHVEGARWAAAALATGDETPPLARGGALVAAARQVVFTGDHARGQAWAEAALALADARGDRPLRVRALAVFALHRLSLGDRAGAAAALADGLAVARALGDGWHTAGYLMLLTTAADPAAARCHAEAALPPARAAGDPWTLVQALTRLAELTCLDGDSARAAALQGEALVLARAQGYPAEIAYALANLATIARRRGDPAGAARALAECLALRRRQGNPYRLALTLVGVAALAVTRGNALGAARLLGAASGILEQGGPVAHYRLPRAEWDEAWAEARDALGDDGFAEAWQAGQSLALAVAVAEAERLVGTGGIA